MIIVKTASNAGAVFNSRDFESMSIAAQLVTANFRTVDSGDTPTRDALALDCTAGKEHEVARGLADLIKSERTVVLDDVNDDFAGLADVTAVNAATINGVPAVSGFHVIEPSTGTLSVADSGAIVILNDNVALKLPTPAVGLEYTFVLDTDMGSNTGTITSTTDGSTAEELFFGVIDVNNSAVQVTNKDVITFNDAATIGDFVVCKCVSTSTTGGGSTWFVSGAGEASGSIAVS